MTTGDTKIDSSDDLKYIAQQFVQFSGIRVRIQRLGRCRAGSKRHYEIAVRDLFILLAIPDYSSSTTFPLSRPPGRSSDGRPSLPPGRTAKSGPRRPPAGASERRPGLAGSTDRKSTRLNSSHMSIS